MNLSEINWPVYRLGEHKPKIEDGITFYSKEYLDKETDLVYLGLRIIDDKSLDGDTLGARRLRLKVDEENLFPIRISVYFLADLIKLAKATTWFIDNHGVVFQYKKSTRAKLTSHKIKNILPGTGMGCIIELEGIPQRFKAMYRPSIEQTYAGVLRWGLGYILYGFYSEHFKPSYRGV